MVNDVSALVAWAGDPLVAVAALEVRDGAIAQVRAALDPDKLNFVRRQLGRP